MNGPLALQQRDRQGLGALSPRFWAMSLGEIVEPLIQLRNLEKVIEAGPNKFYLLRRINLDIQAGDFVTIMGPSGAGKSTLLSIVGMLDGAWRGDFYFLGEPVHKLYVKKRNELHKTNLGFVFHSYHLISILPRSANLTTPP